MICPVGVALALEDRVEEPGITMLENGEFRGGCGMLEAGGGFPGVETLDGSGITVDVEVALEETSRDEGELSLLTTTQSIYTCPRKVINILTFSTQRNLSPTWI